MLPLSLIRAQHFVASWAGAASIKEFPCPFCLLLPQKAAGFVLPSPFAMAVCFSDHRRVVSGAPFLRIPDNCITAWHGGRFGGCFLEKPLSPARENPQFLLQPG